MAEADGIAGLDTSVAHPARVYDYWLGGKDNNLAVGICPSSLTWPNLALTWQDSTNRAGTSRR